MIGRKEELRHAANLLDSVKDQGHLLLLIKGGIGIGKSLFIERLLENYKNDYDIFEISFFDHIAKPYSFFYQAIRLIMDQNPFISQCVPRSAEILKFLSGEQVEGAFSETIVKATIKEIFIASAKNKPLILVFEDFHLSDATSIELLPFLFDGTSSIPFSIVISYKNEYVVHAQNFKKIRSSLSRTKFFHEIELFPLNSEESKNLTEIILTGPVDDEFAHFIYEHSQGNPFFITELVKAYQMRQLLVFSETGWKASDGNDMPLPQAIRDMADMLLSSLSENEMNSVEIAAVMGREFELEGLARISEDDTSLETLFQKKLINEVRPGIGAFRHTLFQEAINAKILWPRRRAINRKLAEDLNKVGKHPELEARYWLGAGDQECARKAYVSAARKYCALHAHLDAVHVANKALELWKNNENEAEKVEVLLELAKCTQIAGLLSDSIKILRQALESGSIQSQPEKKAGICRSLATTQAMQGTWNQYFLYREKAGEYFEIAGMLHESILDWIDLANMKIYASRIEEAIAFTDRAIDNARKLGDKKMRAKILSIKAYALSILGRKKESIELANEAITLAESTNDTEVTAYTYRKLAGVFEYSSDFKKSVNLYESALIFCQREDMKVEAIFCLACMSWVLFKSGDLKRAAKVCQEVMHDPTSNDDARYMVNMVMSLICAYRGEIKSARNCMKKSRQYLDFGAFPLGVIYYDWADGLLAEHENNSTKAYYCYKKILDTWHDIHEVHDSLGGIFSSSIFFFEKGYKDDLNECQKILTSIAESTGNTEAIGCLSFVNGLIAFMSENLSQANDHFEKAISDLQATSARIQIMAVEFYHSLVLLRLNKNPSPILLMNKISQDAKNMGLRPFAEKIKIHLLSHENKESKENTKQNVSISVLGGLTNRQLEILSKIAEGLTNKEIAAQLFLSTRTIDMHVRNIYDHLNCRSRTEAVKLAKEKGIL